MDRRGTKEPAAAQRRLNKQEAASRELRAAQQALQAGEDRFRAQYKGLPIPVYTWQKVDDDFVLTDYNDAANTVTGGRVAQVMGQKASVLYHDSPGILAQLIQCHDERRSFRRDMIYQFRTSEDTRMLSVSYGYVPPDLVLVHTEDVTERRAAEAQRDATLRAQRKERDFTSAVLDTATALVVVLDTEGRIVHFNRACEAVTGYAFPEVQGRRFWDLFLIPEEAEAVQGVFDELTAGQSPNRHENVWLTRNGRRCRIAWSNTALLDDDGAVEYVVATGIDVTEQRQAEQARDTTLEALRATHLELEHRVEARTAELASANQVLREEIAGRQEAQRQLERNSQRERVLNALLRVSLEDSPLQEQLEKALAEILSIPWLPVLRRGAVFLTGDDPHVLELRAQQELNSALQTTCARVPFGTCHCGRAAQSRIIQYAGGIDGRHEIRYEGMLPHGHCCVPILSGERAIGALALYLEEGHPPEPDEEAFLQTVANTLAGIIEHRRVENERDASLEALRRSDERLRALNERLEEYNRDLERMVVARTREIDQRRQVAESLRDILAVLNSNRPLARILDHVVAEASRLLGSGTSAIYALDEEERSGLAPGMWQALRQGRTVVEPGNGDDLAGIVCPDASRGSLEAWGSDCCRALLAVPLVVGDEVYGCLALYYSEPRTFSDEEISLAVAFADQAALAIENARLRQQVRETAILEERGRLARDLHDSVSQSLYSILLLAAGWRRLDQAGRLAGDEEPWRELEAIARQALGEMRMMLHELRPPAVEAEGLVAALEKRLGAVEQRAGIQTRLVAGQQVELAPEVEAGLYRIAVEALNNGLKHADATEVTVLVDAQEDWVSIVVEDNGQGFDPASPAAGQGFGLGGMRERAGQLGAELTIESAPGHGTRVAVTARTGMADGGR